MLLAIYTHFGGMEHVQRAVRQDGFARLAARTDAIPASADPVADLVATSETYFAFGLAHPHLYRAMFIDRPVEDDDAGTAAFEGIVNAVRRCMDVLSDMMLRLLIGYGDDPAAARRSVRRAYRRARGPA